MKTLLHYTFALLLLSVNGPLSIACAQNTAFTYQGQLFSGGVPANGTYNFVFTLSSDNSTGDASVGPATVNNVVITNGLFTVLLDFGPGVFTGQTNWLQVAVETNGDSNFTALTPRQQLTPVPYAIYSASAATATSATNANNFSGSLSGDITGTQGATVVSTVGGVSAVDLAGAANAANTATSAAVVGTIVRRDKSGNFSAGTITANLAGNAATATLAGNLMNGISITNVYVTNSVFAGDGGGLANLNANALGIAPTNVVASPGPNVGSLLYYNAGTAYSPIPNVLYTNGALTITSNGVNEITMGLNGTISAANMNAGNLTTLTYGTNTIAVASTGVTNNTSSVVYLLTITAGSGLLLEDQNGNPFGAPAPGDTIPLKPGWQLTGAGIIAQCYQLWP